MAAKRISIEEFMQLAPHHLVLDVRSPSEYTHAHYPTAQSLPLFDDEERKIVGTTYKQQSRRQAIKIGLDYFGPKMRQMVEQVELFQKERNSKFVIVHCWRGGMRSGAVSWLLDLYGFNVLTLKGGYKAFRNKVIKTFETLYSIRILSGNTGCGKTEILHALKAQQETIIDLEALAGHKGSAFGNLGLPNQESSEQFENKLALALFDLQDNLKPIWIESESSRIGQINIPFQFFNQMKDAPRLHINIPFEQRLDYIVGGYGNFEKQDLIDAVSRIQKRLGGLETKLTLENLEQGNIKAAFEILLKYYDKFYDKSKNIFQPAYTEIELPSCNAVENAHLILEHLKSK